MWTLYKKEINGFFSSLTGYLVIGVFLLLNGLFLWLIPGQFNIPLGGYATLEGLFALSPWVFLFLVPAITMRMLAEEKRSGTLELLKTRPVSELQIIFSKFMASWTLVLLALIPTLVFYWSVSRMGSPAGNIDAGGTWGSYIGLLMLGGIYAAIGIFSSSLTSNQMISFILAVTLSFLFYLGFDFLGKLAGSGQAELFIASLGIEHHYASISRGVLDSRDLLYFLGAIALFLAMVRRSRRYLPGLAALIVIVVGLNLLSQVAFTRIDLTAEKRHSLAADSKALLRDLDQTVHVKIYLDGELPVAFENFRKAIDEHMREFRAYAGARLQYEFVNIYREEDPAARNRIISSLYERGLDVTSVQIRDGEGGTASRMIFPGAMMACRGMEIPVNLLKNNPALGHEQNLNNSTQALEFEFIRAMGSLTRDDVPAIAFIEGHGELDSLQTHSFMNELKNFYRVDRGYIHGHIEPLLDYEALIIARPQRTFNDADKFALDQYLMSGGKLIFLLDPVNPFADSLQGGTTIAMARETGIEDLLFNYGFRVNYDLLSDLQCNYVPVNTATTGEAARFNMMPWVYYPLLGGPSDHPVSRGLNYVFSPYVSSLDTLAAREGLKRSVLLSTSVASRKREVPVYISMEEVMRRPDPALFNQGPFPVAVLAEGNFRSFYRNYPVPEGVHPADWEVIPECKDGAIFVMADGDVAANEVEFEGGSYVARPLGYDPYTRQTFGNGEFLMNVVNYMSDDTGLMELRSREFRLRLLNGEILNSRHQLLKWKLMNLLLPQLLLCLAGLMVFYWRYRRFAGRLPLLAALLLLSATACRDDLERAARQLEMETGDIDRIALISGLDTTILELHDGDWTFSGDAKAVPAGQVAVENLLLALSDLELISSGSGVEGGDPDEGGQADPPVSPKELILYHQAERYRSIELHEGPDGLGLRPAGSAYIFRVRISSWPDLDPVRVINVNPDTYRQHVLFSLVASDIAWIGVENAEGAFRFVAGETGIISYEALEGANPMEGRNPDQDALRRLFSYPGTMYYERIARTADLEWHQRIKDGEAEAVRLSIGTVAGKVHYLEVHPWRHEKGGRADLFRALVYVDEDPQPVIMNYLLLDLLMRSPRHYFQAAGTVD